MPTQSHDDQMSALAIATRESVRKANIPSGQVRAVAVDTTGSSVIPVGKNLQPLGEYYLWCDHRSKAEAAEITGAADREGLQAIQWCGVVYSSEWGFSKLLHWLRHNPEKRAQFDSAFEHCDIVAATLCGITDSRKAKRSVCAMGQKSTTRYTRSIKKYISQLASHTRQFGDVMPALINLARDANPGGYSGPSYDRFPGKQIRSVELRRLTSCSL